MKLYIFKSREPGIQQDYFTMLVVKASSPDEAKELISEFNSDQRIRSSGGCPIDPLDVSDYEWDGWTILDDDSPNRVVHYMY